MFHYEHVSSSKHVANEFGLFKPDEDPTKGRWLEQGRTLEYYGLKSGVRGKGGRETEVRGKEGREGDSFMSEPVCRAVMVLIIAHCQDILEYRKKQRPLRVRTLDMSVKTLLVDDSQTVAELIKAVCARIGQSSDWQPVLKWLLGD